MLGPPTYPSVSKNVLITGFEPFGGDKVNPSELVVKSFEGRLIAGRAIAVCVLPVETRTLRAQLEQAINQVRPDVVICTGLAAGRAAVALERIAVNVLDFEIADNSGVQRKNDAILKGGPEALLSALPLERIVEAWRHHGIPGYVSNTAGTFICNQALYEVLTLTAHAAPPVLAGFVHFPYLPAQAIEKGAEKTPSMSLDLMKKALETLLETVVPWVETRPEEPKPKTAAAAASNLWIPRGLKEVER